MAILLGTDGNDSINGSDYSDTLFGYEGEDLIDGAGDSDWLYGGNGSDYLFGEEGNDVLNGGAGADYLYGDEGNDLFCYDLADAVVSGGQGFDTLEVGGAIAGVSINLSMEKFADIEVVWGGSFADELSGDEGNDILYGLDGNDTLDGDIGNDELYGGNGNDLILSGEGSDILVGGSGDDILVAGTKIKMDATFLAFVLNLSAFIMGQSVIEPENGDFIQGNAESDCLYGTAQDDTLYGYAGFDTLYGGNGDDELYGGEGNDYLDGGMGNDLIVDTSTYYDTIKGGDGDDTLNAGSWCVVDGDAGNDYISGMTQYILNGGAGSDTIDSGGYGVTNGADGDDLLSIGLQGGATLVGGEGNDTYEVNSSSAAVNVSIDNFANDAGTDVLVFKSSTGLYQSSFGYSKDGNDLVMSNLASGNEAVRLKSWFSGAAYQMDSILFANGSHLTASGLTDLVEGGLTTGNDLILGAGGNDILGGDAGNDSLYGFGGNDSLYGRDGDDLLYGNEGNDTLVGGAGNDTLNGDDDADKIYGNDGNDTLVGGAGNDTLNGDDDADKIYGNEGNDTLVGGAGNDTLMGGAGNDTLVGGTGNDLLFVADWYYQTSNFFGNDVIQSDEGDALEFFYMNVGDLQRNRDGNDAVLRNESGSVRLQDWFVNTNSRINQFYFDSRGANIASVNNEDTPAYRLDSDLNWVLDGTDSNDSIIGADYTDEIICGGNGDDTINQSSFVWVDGNWCFSLTSGNDVVYGGSGKDAIFADSGNDTLIGGAGNDKYEYTNNNFDNDMIESDAGDAIMFNGLSLGTLQRVRAGNDVLLRNEYGSICLRDWFVCSENRVEQFYSTEHSLLITSQYYESRYRLDFDLNWALDGTDGNDTINRGVNIDEVIYGGNGNDLFNNALSEPWDGIGKYSGENCGNGLLYGGNGSDQFHSGYGNDTLVGGAGNDLYIYEWNTFYGHDVILADNANSGDAVQKIIYTEDIQRTRDGNDLLLWDSYGSIRLQDWFVTVGRRVNLFEIGGSAYNSHYRDSDGHSLDSDLNWVLAGTMIKDDLQGADVAEIINGYSGNDRIWGRDGDDTLRGGSGNDELWGGNGTDILYGDAGNDILYGDAGNDLFVFFNSVQSSAQLDVLYADKNDSIQLYGDTAINTAIEFGSTFLVFTNGTQKILIRDWFLSDGTLNPNRVNTFIFDDARCHIEGNYFVTAAGTVIRPATFTDDIITGDAQNNHLYGYMGDDTILGLDGEDTLEGGDNSDSLFGGIGNDSLLGDAGDDYLDSGSGNDSLYGGSGNDTILWDGTDLRENVFGGFDVDTLTVVNSDGTTVFNGIFYVDLSSDFADFENIVAGMYNDTLLGDSGDNLLQGGNGANSVEGHGGNDSLYGGFGSDSLYGESGLDFLSGGGGTNCLDGGSGSDTYYFGTDSEWSKNTIALSSDDNKDTIVFDFAANPENLIISRAVGSSDLVISGCNREVAIQNWYNDHQVDSFQFSDGMIYNVKNNQWVQAVASVPEGSFFSSIVEGLRVFGGLAGDTVVNSGFNIMSCVKNFLKEQYDDGKSYLLNVTGEIGYNLLQLLPGVWSKLSNYFTVTPSLKLSMSFDLDDLFGVTTEGRGGYSENENGLVTTYFDGGIKIAAGIDITPFNLAGVPVGGIVDDNSLKFGVELNGVSASWTTGITVEENTDLWMGDPLHAFDDSIGATLGIPGIALTWSNSTEEVSWEKGTSRVADFIEATASYEVETNLVKWELDKGELLANIFSDEIGLTFPIMSSTLADLLFDQNSEAFAFTSSDGITGSEGADQLVGTEYDDWIEGELGTDLLHGYEGNDSLMGGIGDDTCFGGSGSDKYLYRTSEMSNSFDIINESGATTTNSSQDCILIRDDGSTNTALSYWKAGNDLYIDFAQNGVLCGAIEIVNQSDSNYAIEQLRFVDATTGREIVGSDVNLMQIYQSL